MSRFVIGRALRAAAVAALSLSTLGGLAEPAQALTMSSPVVTVTGGVIKGSSDLISGRRTFLGIPYASPPVGSRRFRAPQPLVPWSGTRAATKQGNACPQASNPVQPVGDISEDCLVLNVYAPPAAKSNNLPVMVFVHGGGFVVGSIAQYDPTPLVASGKVIVVEMNYRMGPIGFLALPGLATEGGGTGNYGLLDQQAALRWVRTNAAAFGGNPASVTLFGESAGGQSVCDQLSSPSARGLFERAIVQSGGCSQTRLIPARLATAQKRSNAYAASVGCPVGRNQLPCLRSLSFSALYKNQSAVVTTEKPPTFLPTIDGVTLKATPEKSLRQGAAGGVPIMQGSNRDESRLFIATSTHLSLKRLDANGYKAFLGNMFGAQATRVAAEYALSAFKSADLAAAAVSTDADFSCASAVTADASSRGGSPTWQYEFTGTVPVLDNLDPFFPDGLGAFHGAELYYLFSTAAVLPSTVALHRAASALSAQMIRQWTSFAATGNPNGAGLPRWTRSGEGGADVMDLGLGGSAMITGFRTDHHCDFWATVAR